MVATGSVPYFSSFRVSYPCWSVTWASVANDTLLSVLKTLEWNKFLQIGVKIQAKNCQRLVCKKDHSNASDMEKEWCDSHRVVVYTGKLCIKLLKYKVCLVYVIVCMSGLKSSCAVCGGRTSKSVSIRSKMWHCWRSRTCFRTSESQRWISFRFKFVFKYKICFQASMCGESHISFHIEGSRATIPVIPLFCLKTSAVSGVYCLFFFFCRTDPKSQRCLNKLLFVIVQVPPDSSSNLV